MTSFWLIVMVVLIAPFLAYYVSKFGVMGYLRGKQCYHDFIEEKRSDGKK